MITSVHTGNASRRFFQEYHSELFSADDSVGDCMVVDPPIGNPVDGPLSDDHVYHMQNNVVPYSALLHRSSFLGWTRVYRRYYNPDATQQEANQAWCTAVCETPREPVTGAMDPVSQKQIDDSRRADYHDTRWYDTLRYFRS